MSNYVILTDSGTDFTKEMIEELDVELLGAGKDERGSYLL